MRRGGGPSVSWTVLRRKFPWLPLSQVPVQVRGLGMWEGEASQAWGAAVRPWADGVGGSWDSPLGASSQLIIP